MFSWFKNFRAHPRTTLVGLALGVLQVTALAAQGGLHVGHVGSTDVLGLILAVGTAVLGGAAKDPSAPTAPTPAAK